MHAGTVGTPLTHQRSLAWLSAHDVQEIRHEAVDAVKQWGFETDDLSLVVAELVANVLRHADGNGSLKVSADAGVLLVSVEDYVSTEPVLREPDWESGSGRGIHLVAELAEKWGTEPTRGGKRVWARLALWSKCTQCEEAVPAEEPDVIRGKVLQEGRPDLRFVYCRRCSQRLVGERNGHDTGWGVTSACPALVAC